MHFYANTDNLPNSEAYKLENNIFSNYDFDFNNDTLIEESPFSQDNGEYFGEDDEYIEPDMPDNPEEFGDERKNKETVKIHSFFVFILSNFSVITGAQVKRKNAVETA